MKAQLTEALIAGDAGTVAALTQALLASGVPPREIVDYSLTVRSRPLYHCLDIAVRAPFSCICCTV